MVSAVNSLESTAGRPRSSVKLIARQVLFSRDLEFGLWS